MIIKDRVCQHLRSVGYNPKESSRYASLVQKWCDQSGREWAVERLKCLKAAFQLSLQSGQYELPENWATRKNRHGKKIVRDGFVHRVLSSPNEGKNLIRKEAFLRIYQVIKLDSLSPRQISKMKSAILGESTADERVLESCCLKTKVRSISAKTLERVTACGTVSLVLPQLLGSVEKRSPAFSLPDSPRELTKSKLKSTIRSDISVAKWIDYFAVDQQTNEFWRKYPEFVGERLLGPGRLAPVTTYPEYPKVDLQAGTLTVIQEAGAKARWVANPFLAFQALGEPLKDKLFEYTKQAYADVVCTDDQPRGYAAVEEWLREGRKIYCFDATAFTDRFPLKLQLSVLQQLVDMGVASEADYEGFKLVVQKQWQCNAVGHDVKWTVGQPLGYGPSFHLATLTHAALVDSFYRNSNRPANAKRMFRIVGDDIVIADERLASVYEKTMSKLGVDINRLKSLISNEYGEFLGKLITVEGVNPSIKTKLLISSDQIVDTLQFYGSNGLKWLTPYEKEQAYRVYLPSDLGGYDWRKPGYSYAEWLDATQQGKFAVKRLNNDVLTFYGRESLTGALDLERSINTRIEYYSINGFDLSASEWARLGADVEFNGLTNLPIAKASEQDVQTSPSTRDDSHNDFVSIVDMVAKLANRDDESSGGLPCRGATTAALNDAILRNNHVSITRHGYLHETEKPYTGQSVIEVTNERQNPKADRTRKHDVFTGNGERRWSSTEGPEP